jgi:uncharacterized protein YjbI with pentapeptide repeats
MNKKPQVCKLGLIVWRTAKVCEPGIVLQNVELQNVELQNAEIQNIKLQNAELQNAELKNVENYKTSKITKKVGKTIKA